VRCILQIHLPASLAISLQRDPRLGRTSGHPLSRVTEKTGPG